MYFVMSESDQEKDITRSDLQYDSFENRISDLSGVSRLVFL